MGAILVFACLGLVVQAASCPGPCSCVGDNIKTTANNTTSLHCPDVSDVESLARVLDYAITANISHLQLTNCTVSDATNISVSGAGSLRLLDLSRGRLVALPVLNLTNLEHLDLSRNAVRMVRGAPFRALCALTLLNLSGNALETLAVDTFRGLAGLHTLDLSQNALDHLADRLLVPLVSLHHLNLSANRLERLSEACFGALPHLQQLDVSANRLTHVSAGTLQALPSLSRLLLAGNPALGASIRRAALLVATGRKLHTVDASRTGLAHVPAALTHSVRTLRLAGNRIGAVRCGDLDSYPLLQLLDLSANGLHDLDEDALGRLELLAVLYLTDNKLRAVPRSLPDGLQILHLEANRIEQLVSGDLLGLPHLEVLLLNDNQIKVVQEGAFSQLSALVTLDLSRNPISILPAGTLSGPQRLQTLRLADLAVQPPAQDMAFPVPQPEHLVRLDLSRSAGLARQLLADTAALAAFRDLQELSLVNTGLSNIRSDLLHFLPQLRDFHLAGNRLNCSGLLWLALWMRRQDQPEYRAVACALPPDLYGTLVVDLQDADVRADPDQTTSTTITTLIASSLATEQSTTDASTSTSEDVNITINDSTSTEEPTSTVVPTPVSTTENLETSTSDAPNTETGITLAGDEGRVTMDALTGAMHGGERRRGAAGLLVAMGAVAAAGVLLSTLVSHLRRRRQRAQDYNRHQDIEVNSLASMHELW